MERIIEVKAIYTKPEMELVEVDMEDIIITSSLDIDNGEDGDYIEDGDGPLL